MSAAIESMNGARFVRDQLERAGWQVQLADAQQVKGLAPLACQADRIDAWCWRSCAAVGWCPRSGWRRPGCVPSGGGPGFRLHLVGQRTALKNPIPATLLALGRRCPTAARFGPGGRQRLGRLGLPEPWAGATTAAVRPVDDLDVQLDGCEPELRRVGADHPEVPRLLPVPGTAWVLGPRPPRRSGRPVGSPRAQEAGWG